MLVASAHTGAGPPLWTFVTGGFAAVGTIIAGLAKGLSVWKRNIEKDTEEKTRSTDAMQQLSNDVRNLNETAGALREAVNRLNGGFAIHETKLAELAEEVRRLSRWRGRPREGGGTSSNNR